MPVEVNTRISLAIFSKEAKIAHLAMVFYILFSSSKGLKFIPLSIFNSSVSSSSSHSIQIFDNVSID